MNAVGNRTSLRKRDGQVIGYSYDALNRMTFKDIPGGTVADVYYGYDLRGRQTYARFGSTTGAGITNAYDGFGRLTSSASNMGGPSLSVGSQYDTDGNGTQITHPDGKYFVLGYDGLDLMNNAQWNSQNGQGLVQFVSIGYTAQGLRGTINRASSYTDYGYEGVERLTTLTQRFAGNAGNVTTGFGYNP